MFLSPKQRAEKVRANLVGGKEAVDVFAAAAGLGCDVAAPQRISRTGAVEADLRPNRTRDRFHIRIDPSPRGGWRNTPESIRPALSRHRFRFRVCHELGHTFFYDRRAGFGPRRSRAMAVSEEAWCDDFARSLLVPHRAAADAPVNADSPFALLAQFDVSLELATRAFISAHRRVDAAIWFWAADADLTSSSLLQQWTSLSVPSLRSWREADVVAEAIADGQASGALDDLSHPGQRIHVSARCDAERRQLIVVTGR